MGDKKYPMDKKHPNHQDGCMCERCYNHNYPKLDVVKVLNQIKNMLNEEHMQQYISKNNNVFYAITKVELEKSNNQVNAIDMAIKIMELLPEMIEDIEYLLDMAEEESGLDAVASSNNQDIRNRLNKAKE